MVYNVLLTLQTANVFNYFLTWGKKKFSAIFISLEKL